MRKQEKFLFLIAGPTASGKSALALDIAEEFRGTIINADSLQMYADLQILSGRPSTTEVQRVPHRLYGTWDGNERGSVAKWCDAAIQEITKTLEIGRWPILVGGTGLYFKALTEGLSPIPSVSEEIFKEAQVHWEKLGPLAFHSEINRIDPSLAGRLKPHDRQRLTRAWAVYRSTGIPLSTWQEKVPQPLLPPHLRLIWISLNPPRPLLYAACDQRFQRMVQTGAIDEVKNLLARHLDPSLPVMKAVGVPELSDFIQGKISLKDAIQQGQQATRNYAKRQVTWFKNQLWETWGSQENTLLWPEFYTQENFSQIKEWIKKFIQ